MDTRSNPAACRYADGRIQAMDNISKQRFIHKSLWPDIATALYNAVMLDESYCWHVMFRQSYRLSSLAWLSLPSSS